METPRYLHTPQGLWVQRAPSIYSRTASTREKWLVEMATATPTSDGWGLGQKLKYKCPKSSKPAQAFLLECVQDYLVLTAH